MFNHVHGQVWKRVWIFEARSEHFSVWIWRCGRHTFTKSSKEYPPPGYRWDAQTLDQLGNKKRKGGRLCVLHGYYSSLLLPISISLVIFFSVLLYTDILRSWKNVALRVRWDWLDSFIHLFIYLSIVKESTIELPVWPRPSVEARELEWNRGNTMRKDQFLTRYLFQKNYIVPLLPHGVLVLVIVAFL